MIAMLYEVAGNAFDWLLPDQLGACVNPAVAGGAATELRARQIGLLINLHERPDPPELLVQLRAETVHLPVQNSDAPTPSQLDRGVAAIGDALSRGIRVAVHCGAGLGRSGTLLAAYLVSQGSAPDEAIAQVRAARPGSIETAEQEAAVYHFARDRGSDAGDDRSS
jgi:atypical dual specificity phosphatase